MSRMWLSRWLVALVLLLAATTAWAGKNRRVDFKSVPLGTFEKSACSPSSLPGTKAAVRFNMPKEIVWGAPLPICGVARPSKDEDGQSRRIRIRLSVVLSIDRDREISGDIVEGDRAELLRDGLIFFNMDGFGGTGGAALSPGTYRVSLFFDQNPASGASRSLRVVSAGWRKELVEMLVHHLCAENLSSDLAPYFQFLHVLAEERPADGEAASADQRLLEKKWRRGFTPHATMLTPEIREGLRTLRTPDSGMVWHVWQTMRGRCPSISPENHRPIEGILAAILHYEIQP
jgi:hypothetical protein